MKKVYLYLLLISILAVSCVTQEKCNERFPPRIYDSIVYVEKWHDSTIYITDSAGITAQLECDTAGIVKIKAIRDMYSGQWIKPSVVIRDNFLTAKCVVDSGKVAAGYIEKNFKSIRVKVVNIETNIIKPWQWAQIWAGRLLILVSALFASIKFGVPLVKKVFKIGV
jgi:hypothetical protein